MSLRTALTGFAGDAQLPEVRPGRGPEGRSPGQDPKLGTAADGSSELGQF